MAAAEKDWAAGAAHARTNELRDVNVHVIADNGNVAIVDSDTAIAANGHAILVIVRIGVVAIKLSSAPVMFLVLQINVQDLGWVGRGGVGACISRH